LRDELPKRHRKPVREMRTGSNRGGLTDNWGSSRGKMANDRKLAAQPFEGARMVVYDSRDEIHRTEPDANVLRKVQYDRIGAPDAKAPRHLHGRGNRSR
jgi:hypothetical protein